MRFNEIKYERINIKEQKKNALELIKNFKKATNFKEAKEVSDKLDQLMADNIHSTVSYVHIMNTIDTSNKFYEDEVKYYNTHMLPLLSVSKKLNKAIINSKFKDDFVKEGYSLTIKLAQVALRQSSIKNILLKIKESNLSMEYSKIVAQAKTTFNGKEMNFYGLLKEMQSENRETRKEALKAWSNLYESISPRLDEIYNALVLNRAKQAKRLKYPSYVNMVYEARNIFDYDANDIHEFKESVKKYIVPLCVKLHHEQEERLGIDHLYYYDEGLFYPDGAIEPIGNTEELVLKANKMYNQMSKETGEFFTFMRENQFFDLETKPNKRGGGYCSSIPKYKAPFIFSNFNGTSADVDVLTHEAGHAFAAYTSLHGEKDIYAQNDMTMDIAEIHSMSMEHFAYPYMELFFEDKADKYCLAHFEEALMTIPYLCAVDEFQHQVFKNINSTAKEKRAMWKQIEKEFMPWRDYDDNEFLNEGGFWMQKQHIFVYPFYYVDYALSQICAFQFYQRELKDHNEAWTNYYKLCQIAGHQGYLETLKLVGLNSPFDEETIKNVCGFVTKQIEVLKKKVK